MSTGTILVIILIVLLVGGYARDWGSGPMYGLGHGGGGLLGLVLVVILILVLLGKI